MDGFELAVTKRQHVHNLLLDLVGPNREDGLALFGERLAQCPELVEEQLVHAASTAQGGATLASAGVGTDALSSFDLEARGLGHLSRRKWREQRRSALT
jgi:hypothetical protein